MSNKPWKQVAGALITAAVIVPAAGSAFGCDSREEVAEREAIAAAEAAAARVAATRPDINAPPSPPDPVETMQPRNLEDLTSPATRPGGGKQYDAPPEMQIDVEKTYTATIHTNRGDIKVELFDDAAPKTVNNFVFLAREDFYDGTIFHRVIDDFMIQGGDPTGTGTGGPGYRFEDEIDGNPHRHEAYTLSMANAGANTNGSQFFITEGPTPHLDGRHTIFGRVVEGKDVVSQIASTTTGPGNKPVEDVVIEDVTIEEQ